MAVLWAPGNVANKGTEAGRPTLTDGRGTTEGERPCFIAFDPFGDDECYFYLTPLI